MNIHFLLDALRPEFRKCTSTSTEVDWQSARQRDTVGSAADFIEYLEHRFNTIDVSLPKRPLEPLRRYLKPETTYQVTGADKLLLGVEHFMSVAAGSRFMFVSLGSPRGLLASQREAFLGRDASRLLIDDAQGKLILEGLADRATRAAEVGKLLAQAKAASSAQDKPVSQAPVVLSHVGGWSIHIDRLGVTIQKLIELILLIEQDFDATLLVSGNLHNMAPILLKLPTTGQRGYSIATSGCGLVLLAVR